jgi:3-oxoacyl-[acyl-carrier-protein] synthase-3
MDFDRKSAKILGTGSYVPERVLTNEEIEQMVPNTNAEWTYRKLGVRERHIAGAHESTADLAILASKMALDKAGITPNDLDLIILGTTTPRRPAPSTACYIQHQLSAEHCAAFDLSAVCSSFIYSMVVGTQFIQSGAYKNVLVIGADTFSKITDWSRRDCVFFGDGAGAAVLTACPMGEGVLSFDLGSDGSEEFAWTIPAGGSEMPTTHETLEKGLNFWHMDGQAVYNMATLRIPQTLQRSLEKAGMSISDIDHVLPHQPSMNVLKKTAEIMDIPFNKFYTNMDKYANTSAATVAIILDEAVKSGSLKEGDIVAFAAVGAGWAWGSLIMRWS